MLRGPSRLPCYHVMECDYSRGFDWWPDLLHTLIQRITTLYISLLHTLMSTVTYTLPLLGRGFQRRTFSFLWIPELSPASATSFSQQQLTTTQLQRSSNSLTHSPTNWTISLHWLQLLTTPAYNVSAWTARKHRSCVAEQLLSWKHACLRNHYLVTAVAFMLIWRSLPSNGSACHNILHKQCRVRFCMVFLKPTTHPFGFYTHYPDIRRSSAQAIDSVLK
jgi:hypothetical protein